MTQRVKNLTSTHEDVGFSLASLSGLRIRHCSELWRRSKMWLGSGVAAAVASSAPSLGTSLCSRCSPKETINQPTNQPTNQQGPQLEGAESMRHHCLSGESAS